MHKTKNTIKGTIFTSNFLDMSEAELLERLTDQGVVEVFNVPKRDKSGKSPRYFLTFAGQVLPDRILAEGLSIKVEATKSTPRRCPKCQEFGHGERSCTNDRVCCKCGQASEHTYKDCPNDTSCINCGQKHPASFPQCPVYQFEEAVIGLKTADKLTDTAAREHALRTHHLADSIPKLKKEKEKLPSTAAEMVARAKGRPNPAPIRYNNGPPPAQSDQADMKGLLRPLEDQLASQNQLLTQQSELIKIQASTIETLQTCMMGMINAPTFALGAVSVDGSLKDLQDKGVITENQRTAAAQLLTKSGQAIDSRKSRSRSRRPSTNSRDSRSKSNKSVPRGPKSKEPRPPFKSPPRVTNTRGSLPSTPIHGEKRKAGRSPSSAETSPDSPTSRSKKAEHSLASENKIHRAATSDDSPKGDDESQLAAAFQPLPLSPSKDQVQPEDLSFKGLDFSQPPARSSSTGT